MHKDNQGAVALAKKPHDHGRTKHIDICYHYSREEVKDGTIKLHYCRTDANIANIFTKPLPCARFRDLVSMHGMYHSNVSFE